MIYEDFHLPLRMQNINPSDESTKVGKFAEDQIRDELEYHSWLIFREDNPAYKIDMVAFHIPTGALVAIQSRGTMSPKYRKVPYYDNDGIKQVKLEEYYKLKTGQTSSKKVKQKAGGYRYMISELEYTRSTLVYVFPMFNPQTKKLIIAFYKSHTLKGTKFVTIDTNKSYCRRKTTLVIDDHNLDLRKLIGIPERSWGIPNDYAMKKGKDYQMEQSNINTFGQWSDEELKTHEELTGKTYI